jgi:RNA-directed DNA polymerase
MPNNPKGRMANGRQAIGYSNSTNERCVMQPEERRIHMKLSCEATLPARRGREKVETKLQRIAQKAAKDEKFQFTSLYHLMSEELLSECFEKLSGRAASGIDGVTKSRYAENLSTNIAALVKRLHKMSYHPLAARRVYIPKAGSNKMRPLGIPSLEDKLVQAGLVRILEKIYESDFIDNSYGFRLKRSCHDALKRLSNVVEDGRVNYIVEADIKGFFDNVNHNWLMRFLGHRINDKRVLQMIKRFLISGVIENGRWSKGQQGVPQGGLWEASHNPPYAK